ncbi:Uu.00g026810.m01.CDS01 [Anthostomella pinea]|uniref:Uu.00g026810.m01.CDS01 n=1 Tax=Anthostomella pinea TaxID=933095 RepID=A0AAI8V7N3_9PEZI|nr:Uu.00g026810.m01.CDS01 [Anthostomella pinea]
MQSISTSLIIAAGSGIFAMAWAAGIGSSLTLFAIPAIVNNGAPADVMWRGLATAAASTIFIIPYTVAFIFPTNAKLLAAADEKSREKTLSVQTATGLIRKWGQLNVVRVIVPMIGTGLALWNFCL